MNEPIPKPVRLNKRGHVYGCACPSCRGARNRRKGLKTQRAHLKALAAAEGTLQRFWSQFGNEETAGLRMFQVESKKGGQIPRLLVRAFSQCEAAIAIGSGRKPMVILEPEGTSRALAVMRLEDLLEIVRAVRSAEGGEE